MNFEPNKRTVVADAVDEVVWGDLPPKTHWTTYQTVLGGSNEFDYEGTTNSLTFAPAGIYYIIIAAEGVEPYLVTITATEPEVTTEAEE